MKNKKIPPLSFLTKRLKVRALERFDYKVWKKAYINSLPNQNEFDESYLKPQDINYKNFLNIYKRFKNHTKNGVIYQFFAFYKKYGDLISSTQCALIQRFNVQKACLGFEIMNNHWRLGYGKELVNGMIEHTFRKLKLHRLEAEIIPSNFSSIKLVEKLGMKYEGLRRNAGYENGKWEDYSAYAITAEDRGIKNMKPNHTLL